MATRFSADATAYTATAALPVPGGSTVMFWLKMSVDRAQDQVFWGCQNMLDMAHLYFGCDAARVMTLADDSTSITAPGGAMVVGTWYKIAFVWTSATAFTIYKAPAGSALASSSGTLSLTPTNVLKMWLGASRYTGSWWNGALQNYRQWSAVLTSDELAAEFASPVAQRTTNLVRSHNLIAPATTVSSAVADDSGNGNTILSGATASAFEQASIDGQSQTAIIYATAAAADSGTWTNTANAVGSGTGTNATWVSAVSGATAQLGLTFDLAAAGVPANAVINALGVRLLSTVSSTTNVASGSVQELFVGVRGVQGGFSAGFVKFTAATEYAYFALVAAKIPDLSTFKVALLFTRAANTTSSTVSIDRVGLVVDYTMDEESGRPMLASF